MSKLSVCVLFGGVSPEHEVSLRSAEFVLNTLDKEKYKVFAVGITKDGQWIRYGGEDYSLLPDESWMQHPANRKAALSPVWGQGLLTFEGDRVQADKIDVVFPVLHGENGEDGTIQGLMELARIPYVGCHVAASAVAMDKTLTKLAAERAHVRQADWVLVWTRELSERPEAILDEVEAKFQYPVFVKPAGTGSSVGVSKCWDREGLRKALQEAGKFDSKILVEEFIDGQEVEVAVLGNENPVASIPGEIDSGAEFYDYEAKYITDTYRAYVPARIPEASMEEIRKAAVRVYQAVGCNGLSRVDFFLTRKDHQVVFNEINTLPGFTSISMYPKLFEHTGIPSVELLDRLIELACEACKK